MKIDNTNGDEFANMFRRIRALETGSPIGSSSVTRGRLRIGGTATLLVDGDGGAIVDGTLTVNGTENVTGNLGISGALGVTGTTTLNGPVGITGTTTLTGDMTVNGVGKITVAGSAPVTLGIASNGFPGLQFPSGNLTGGGSTIEMQSGNAAIGVTSGQASMVVGTGGLGVNASGVSVTTIGATTSAANVFITTAGLLQKVSSAARFKRDVRPLDLPDELLSVTVKDWLDAGAQERGEAPTRVPGVIAEEVEAAGGSQFVTYDADGRIEGVAYDRLALVRTAILERQLGEALEQIAELQRKSNHRWDW